jgi:YfiH family protein
VNPSELPTPLTVPALSQQEALIHGFSTRTGGVSRCYRPEGDLNLGFTSHDDAANVRENRTRFLASLGAADIGRFGLLHQQHTPIVHVLHTAEDFVTDFTQPATLSGDGLVTNLPKMLLTVQIADCIPVLLFDPKQRAIGAFHAGWRGTVARIVELGVEALRAEYGTNPKDLIAAIGPGIGPESYSVGAEVQKEFRAQFDYADELFRADAAAGQLYLNLWEANSRQLQHAGVPAENITVTGNDTATNTDRFFSHRAEKGFTGRMMASIGMTA